MKTPERITETTTDASTCGLNRARRSLASVAAFVAVALLSATAHAADPYIESTSRSNTGGISTGYRMNGDSRVEVDFALTTTDDCAQWRIFGDDVRDSSLKTYLYIDGDLHYTLIVSPNGISRYTTYAADTQRHTAVFDLYHSGLHFITEGVTNWTVSSATSFAGRKANLPLSLFGRYVNTYANKFEAGPKARIYGVKIYERDVLVHDFVPCLKNGETPCFKDLVGGGFICGEETSKFTAGGDVPTYLDDGYVSMAANAAEGKLYIDTGYKVSAKTAVALDCAVTGLNTRDGWFGLFDCNGGTRFMFDINKWNGKLRYSAGGNTSLETFADSGFWYRVAYDVRRTLFLDNLNAIAAVVTSGFTNQTATFTVSTPSTANGTSLKIASSHGGDGNYAPIKVYGCKILEDGTLVRDYVPWVENGTPGLRDRLTGTFRAIRHGSGDTTSNATYGGYIMGERDAYLEPTGSVGINTGVKLNGRSRFEVDFALTVTNANTKNWRVFGTDTQESNLKTWLGYDSALNTRMELANNNRYPTKADTARHLAGMNMVNGSFLFATGATTNSLNSVTTDLSEREASLPLPIFGRYSNAEGTTYHNYTVPSARIYSVRIWESDSLTHEFLPYSRGGVVGFYDTVTGNIISNGSSFTFGGMGQDHGQLKCYVKPGYATEVTYGKTVALTAYAPGATSYRWLMDGEPIAGGTDGTFNVEWARGGTRIQGGYRHEYQAVAVFDDFYGVTRESAPSAPATVTSLPRALTIIVK